MENERVLGTETIVVAVDIKHLDVLGVFHHPVLFALSLKVQIHSSPQKCCSRSPFIKLLGYSFTSSCPSQSYARRTKLLSL